MKYYIVLTKINAERIRKESQKRSQVQRSDLLLLSQNLNASFIEQRDYPIRLVDRICAQLSSTPENWAFARSIAAQLKSDDIVFCPGEEIGIPLARVCSQSPENLKIVVWFHRITGLRTRVALKLFKIADLLDLAVVSNLTNKNFLKNYLGLLDKQILFLWHLVDGKYFAPETSSPKPRSVVMSVGLEYRDYNLLAAATAELDVEVKIAGFSQFQSRTANLPKVMPRNMSNQRYSLSALLELYHQADLVVICLKENTAAAGVTVLLEAMCCKKPIICTRTTGLDEYLSNEQAIMTIEPGDLIGLQKAILYLLEHPEEAKFRAERAYQLASERHNLEQQVEVLANFIRTSES